MHLISLVLDKESAAKVAAYAKFGKVYAHHVTIAYKPDEVTRIQFRGLIGTKINFKTIELVSDYKAIAFRVVGVPSLNLYPHITVCCEYGIKPAYCNTLLANVILMKDAKVEKIELELSGTVTEE